jgi:hypothetical protein
LFCYPNIINFIAGNCVLSGFSSESTKKINKISYKTVKNANVFVILLILFVNSLFKQQSTQLPAMKIFNCAICTFKWTSNLKIHQNYSLSLNKIFEFLTLFWKLVGQKFFLVIFSKVFIDLNGKQKNCIGNFLNY